MEGRTWDELVGSPLHVGAATRPPDLQAATRPYDLSVATPPHDLLAATPPHDPPVATPPHDRPAATLPHDPAPATGFIDLAPAEIPIELPSVQTRRVSRVFAAKATHKGDGQDDDDEVQILGSKPATRRLRGYRKCLTAVPKAKQNRGKRGRYAPVPETLPIVHKKPQKR